ncbi:MAG: 30S ribosomal protein S6 [Chloroflexi bacterium]|nr:30S ribosomal protein S6 [Chloroflexota bacterium]
MQEYEMVTLFHPGLDEEGVEAQSQWLQQRITDLGGEVVEVTPWGRRNLAFAISKQKEATYYQFDFRLEGKQVDELTRVMRLNEDVLRQLPVRKQDR